MEPNKSTKMNTYQILVKEARNHHTVEWSGNLTLITDDNEVTFLEISFSDRADIPASQDKFLESNNSFLSVEYIETETLQKVEA